MIEISEYEEGQILECVDASKFDQEFYTKGKRYVITGVDPFGKELFMTDNNGSENHPFDDRRLLHKAFKVLKTDEL